MEQTHTETTTESTKTPHARFPHERVLFWLGIAIGTITVLGFVFMTGLHIGRRTMNQPIARAYQTLPLRGRTGFRRGVHRLGSNQTQTSPSPTASPVPGLKSS